MHPILTLVKIYRLFGIRCVNNFTSLNVLLHDFKKMENGTVD